jgi:hypothetical protein
MIKFLFIVLFTINTYGNITIDKAIPFVKKAIDTKKYAYFFKAIKILNTSQDNSLDVLVYTVNLELTLSKVKGPMDFIATCNTLQKINKINEIEFSEAVTEITNSKNLEKSICKKINNFSGQLLLDIGLKILSREEKLTKYNINHALPYFKKAEELNFHDPELYDALIYIYSDKKFKDWKKINTYTKKFLSTSYKKDMYKGRNQRLYAMSRYILTPNSKRTKKFINSIILDFKKAKAYGDTKSSFYINDLKNINRSSQNSTYKYCNYLSNNRDMYMCKGGKYCDYLSNNRDMYMCKRGKYCNYLSNNRDMYMCKGGKYCDYLSNNRDMYMCKGGKYCDYLSDTQDIYMCKGMRR